MLTEKEKRIIYKEIKDNLGLLGDTKESFNLTMMITSFSVGSTYDSEKDYSIQKQDIEDFIKDVLTTVIKAADTPLKTELSILKAALTHQSKALKMAFIKNDPKTASTVAKEVERIRKEIILLNTTGHTKDTKNKRILNELEKLEAQIPKEYLEDV